MTPERLQEIQKERKATFDELHRDYHKHLQPLNCPVVQPITNVWITHKIDKKDLS